MEVVKTAVILS